MGKRKFTYEMLEERIKELEEKISRDSKDSWKYISDLTELVKTQTLEIARLKKIVKEISEKNNYFDEIGYIKDKCDDCKTNTQLFCIKDKKTKKSNSFCSECLSKRYNISFKDKSNKIINKVYSRI